MQLGSVFKMRHRLKFSIYCCGISCLVLILWVYNNRNLIESKGNLELLGINLRKAEQAKAQDDTNHYVEARNKIRLERIKTVCRRKDIQLIRRRDSRLRTIMDPKQKIVYCRVNKVASTYTLKTLQETFNCSLSCLRETSRDLLQLPFSDFRNVISRSYKFMFVREPYGRLFSTYSNKFYFTKEHWAPIGPRIIERYRENPSLESLMYGHDITFHEMIRFLVDEFMAGHKLDEHLRPMYSNCEPCDYSYDFIGNLETMESDWAYLKDIWHNRKIVALPDAVGEDTRVGIPELSHVRKTIKMFKNSTLSQYKLYVRAWSYFQITGHVYKHITMPFVESSNINIDDFQTALLKAVEQSKSFADECKNQKKEALLQAYTSVPLTLLERLKNVLEVDCNLFGYEKRPEWVFVRNNISSEFNYFEGLA